MLKKKMTSLLSESHKYVPFYFSFRLISGQNLNGERNFDQISPQRYLFCIPKMKIYDSNQFQSIPTNVEYDFQKMLNFENVEYDL